MLPPRRRPPPPPALSASSRVLAAASLFAALVQACSAGDTTTSSGSVSTLPGGRADAVPPRSTRLHPATGVEGLVHLDRPHQALDFAVVETSR
jgi:hypothetical protein